MEDLRQFLSTATTMDVPGRAKAPQDNPSERTVLQGIDPTGQPSGPPAVNYEASSITTRILLASTGEPSVLRT